MLSRHLAGVFSMKYVDPYTDQNSNPLGFFVRGIGHRGSITGSKFFDPTDSLPDETFEEPMYNFTGAIKFPLIRP